jgi:predicted AlkP superfamily pyrophosphatase or phosphodiesterase
MLDLSRIVTRSEETTSTLPEVGFGAPGTKTMEWSNSALCSIRKPSCALLENEQLGQDEVPDYLVVSFSSTDYVGHLFGASSLESEDKLAHLDRTLAGLLSWVDQKVGLENILIALSADHGQPEVPGYLHGQGMENAGYFDTTALDKEPAIAALKKEFGFGEELIEAFFQPYLYLNDELIREKGLDQAAVEQAVVGFLGLKPPSGSVGNPLTEIMGD